MKLIVNIIVALALAAIAKANLLNFRYSGERLATPDNQCSPWYLYWTMTYDDDDDQTGYFEVDDCLESPVSLDDGTNILHMDPNLKTCILVTSSVGLTINGQWDTRPEKVDDACDGGSCPMGSTLTCFFGGGPNGGRNQVDHCPNHLPF